MLFIVDTCQAASLYQKFYSPNVLAIGSSLVGEDSLSHHVDPAIGVYIIDRYTYYALEFLEHVTPSSNQTLGQFVSLLIIDCLLYLNLTILFLCLHPVKSLSKISLLINSRIPERFVPARSQQGIYHRLFWLTEAGRNGRGTHLASAAHDHWSDKR